MRHCGRVVLFRFEYRFTPLLHRYRVKGYAHTIRLWVPVAIAPTRLHCDCILLLLIDPIRGPATPILQGLRRVSIPCNENNSIIFISIFRAKKRPFQNRTNYRNDHSRTTVPNRGPNLQHLPPVLPHRATVWASIYVRIYKRR